MSVAVDAPAFVVAAVGSLGLSHVMAQRIERVAERFGLSEGLLGVVAAMAADAPEITSAVTAISRHQAGVGAGVVLGSGVFNLAALLGVGVIMAGTLHFHRKVVLLAGSVTVILSLLGLITVSEYAPAGAAVALALVVLLAFGAVLGFAGRGLGWLPLPVAARTWLVSAVAEEESEMAESVKPEPGGLRDALVAIAALVVVVAGSVVMERSAAAIGDHFGVPEIIVGALVLGVVTAIPNAVASTYLASRGRGAAALSTALNSNNINVALGLLVPAAAVGLGSRSGDTVVVAAWCLALTLATLAASYRWSGLHRPAGWVIVGSYGAFLATVLAIALA